MVEYKIKNKIEPFALGSIEEKGYIGHLIERQIYNRINSDFARNTIYPLCEEVFRTRPDERTGVGLWQGEFWGKWMISACRACRYKNDSELKDFLHKAALSLVKTADANGYIGTYKDSKNFMPTDVEKGKEAVGWLCDWNWNIWCRKYTLWGLLEAYELTGDERILSGAAGLADHLISELEAENIKLWETGTFVGMPSASIMKPMLILYRITENRKYLDFSLSIADSWDDEGGKEPNLIRNAFSGKPIDDWYENEGGRWTKAYELMSCLDGLLELYRITGIKRYHEATRKLFELLWRYEQNPLLSVGFNDQLISGAKYVNAASEPCDVIHLYRLIYELYCLEGSKEYADLLELIGYNPMLASLSYDAKWGARILRSHGKHQFAPPQPGPDPLPHHHCCVNNMPRGLLNFAESAVMRSGDDIYINFYTPYELSGEITVKIGEGYLEKGCVRIKTENAKRIFVRIPEFSERIIVNGREEQSDGGYYPIPDGEKESFELQFNMKSKILRFEDEMIFPESDDVHYRRWGLEIGDTGYVDPKYMLQGKPERVMYGPLLLARSIRLTPEEDITKAEGGCKSLTVQPERVSSDEYQLLCGVKADGREYRMCDFASASRVEDENAFDFIFNIYI